ncbi:MAG TPA: Flp pilus assembly protein CpaB, partial [Alphaproteobacteria bacterium]
VRTVDMLVASKDLKIGEELDASSTTWKAVPESAVFAGAITRKDKESNTDAVKGRLKRDVALGEPMFKSALIDDTKSNFVAANLTAGMRAVAIPVSAQTGVSGFISPGDYVDVVMTYDVRLPSDDNIKNAAIPIVARSAAQTILENIKVLAVDQATDQMAEAKLAKTVTLEVDGKSAEILALAENMGKLSLTLRGVGDKGPTIVEDPKDKAKSKATTDLRISNIMSELLHGENNTGSTNQVVRIYSGTRVENVSVRPYHAQ